MATEDKASVTSLLQGPPAQKSLVFEKTDDYLKFFDATNEKKKPSEKVQTSKHMVNNFYDIVTDFYEYGWGESFHFAPQRKGETFQQAIEKHELFLAMKLALQPGEEVFDLGCGVGGPARSIAAFSHAKVKGINNNDYQIRRAKHLTEKAKLSHLASFEKGDFMHLAKADDSVPKAYAIEATCHAAVKKNVYAEIYRVLRPGGRLAVYEWALTDRFDPSNDEHVKVRDGIREGNALPVLDTCSDVRKALETVGFNVLEFEDMALTSEVPWEATLQPAWTNFRATPVGRFLTHTMLMCLEGVRFAPAGSTKAHTMLCKAADDLVRGGNLGIFTPMLFFLVEKPAKPEL